MWTISYKYDKGGEQGGMSVSHIDDFLHASIMEFENNVMVKMEEQFLQGK